MNQGRLNRVGENHREIMIRVGSRFAIVTQCRIDDHCLFDMNSGSVDPHLPSDIGALRDDLKKLTYRKKWKTRLSREHWWSEQCRRLYDAEWMQYDQKQVTPAKKRLNADCRHMELLWCSMYRINWTGKQPDHQRNCQTPKKRQTDMITVSTDSWRNGMLLDGSQKWTKNQVWLPR